MLYQNILDESAPYRVFVASMSGFPAHRHADMEFSYCLTGEFEIILDRRPYTVHAGDLLLISPMVSHEIPPSYAPERRVLTGVLGPSLLREEFSLFSEVPFPSPLLRESEIPSALKEALLLAAERSSATSHEGRLSLLASLFGIASQLAALLSQEGREHGDLRAVAGIEPALELIWYGYRAPLTVEMAADATGYGKSNFCKIFRTVTGESFHRALNRRRIRAACDLLETTALPISAIAAEVGLPEPKTFARVFREVAGCTPREYRKAPHRPPQK